MPVIKLSESDCYYQYQDFGNDKILVFSNSLGTDLSMWDYTIDILSHHFNILRLDTRGHGQSSTTSGALKIEELGQDLMELLDDLKFDKVYFCGLSMGGLIGQWLGIHHSERFEKLIICNTAAKIGTEEGWNTRIKQVKSNGLASLLTGTAERWFTPAFRAVHKEIVKNILCRFGKTDVNGYLASCAAVRDADFREQLYDLEVPTLIISGSQDEVTTIEDGRFLAKRIPVSRHVSLDAAHLSSIECAEEFAKHIIHFSAH